MSIRLRVFFCTENVVLKSVDSFLPSFFAVSSPGWAARPSPALGRAAALSLEAFLRAWQVLPNFCLYGRERGAGRCSGIEPSCLDRYKWCYESIVTDGNLTLVLGAHEDSPAMTSQDCAVEATHVAHPAIKHCQCESIPMSHTQNLTR